jgi:site-specific recombinase XerD
MNNALVTLDTNNSFEVLVATDLLEKAKFFASKSRAENTKKSYASDWRHFEGWCNAHKVKALPAEPSLVAAYLTSLSETCKVSTLQRRLSTIRKAHSLAGFKLDTSHISFIEVWDGIKRTLGNAQKRKAPVLVQDLREIVQDLPGSLPGIRDRALLLLGFSGAFRRSELVSLNVEDLQFTRDGIVVSLKKSKTDQTGQGKEIGIPYGSARSTCPVRAVQDWLDSSQIQSGALFRSINRHGSISDKDLSDKSVALIVKKHIYNIAIQRGMTPEEATIYAAKYSGHSLRAGFATSAVMSGVAEHSIMQQTRHARSDTLRKYIRLGNMWKENAASKVGL